MSPAIRLVTEIPGPKSRAMSARRSAAVPKGVAVASSITVTHADNALLTDADGNTLIDFAGGIGTLNAGHRHPSVVGAVRDQLDHLTHSCFAVASYEPYIALAERLNRITPGTHAKRTLLVNSGAEAIENAVKIARYATGRPAIVAFEHAFHGRTNLTMSLTAKTIYKKGFGPFAPEVYRAPFPYCYRCTQPDARGTGGQTCCQARAGYWDQVFTTLVEPTQVAGILMELEAGEGGFIAAPPEAVAAIAAFAKQHGILLIIDEIQSGFGRTGKMFACDHYGIVPDLMTMAKSLAGGLPLAAVTGRAEIMDAPHAGGLGGTYGGNPLACAGALAVLDVMEKEQLAQQGAKLGATVRNHFCQLATRYSAIGDVRGLGAMVAMELVKDRTTKEPDKELATKVQAAALARGLVMLTTGTYGNVIRILVPLTVSDELLAEGLKVIEQSFDAVGAAG